MRRCVESSNEWCAIRRSRGWTEPRSSHGEIPISRVPALEYSSQTSRAPRLRGRFTLCASLVSFWGGA